MMRQTLQPSLIASGSGRTILIAGGERGVIYMDGYIGGLSAAVYKKAQQYGVWPEVRRWAKEHPLAVKFVNQDTDMIHSIAQTGWTRWIVGDGASYINSEVIINGDDRVKSHFQYSSNNAILFGADIADNNRQFGIANGNYGARYGNGGNKQKPFNYLGKDVTVDFNKNELYVNGSLLYNFGYENYNTGYWMPIFGKTRSGKVISIAPLDTKIEFVDIIRQSGENKHFIPHVTADGIGMLDLVNYKFHPNLGTGSFTIDLTPNQ